jgi:hypothetical protein
MEITAMLKRTRTVVWLVFMTASPAVYAQTNAGDFQATYGVNYASWDRGHTAPPVFTVPGQFLIRPTCTFMVGVDDDTFVRNYASDSTPAASGTGNAGLEAHGTFWVSTAKPVSAGDCPAKSNSSLTANYVVGIPVHGTLESLKPSHQLSVTYVGLSGLAQLTVSGGVTIAGESASDGSTTYSRSYLFNGNYARYTSEGSNWMGEVETDLQSATATAPFSATLLLVIDRFMGQQQNVILRAGTALGITSSAPRFSPFIQIIVSGNLKSHGLLE